MTPKHLFILLLALFATSFAQNDDELHIPMENDNQFPPDDHSELDGALDPVEGSGAGIIEQPLEATAIATESSVPILEDVQLSTTLVNNDTKAPASEHSCPESCVCNVEGDSSDYIVDCSGLELTEIPKSLDSKTTQLKLQNNKLTEIPKDISSLKDLKVLNVNDNQIMDIVAGSISELPELTSLKLGNNRLIEYPTDLKNSFGLTKLEELDLGGNDMRTALKSETFSNFKALRKLILPTAASDLVEDLCVTMKESLETVCTESCTNKSFDCPDAPHSMDEDLLDFALPGLMNFALSPDEIADPSISTTTNLITDSDKQDNVQTSQPATNEATTADNANPNSTATTDSFRSVVSKASNDESNPTDTVPKLSETNTRTSNAEVTTKTDEEVVGATTSNSKTGSVDKSVIGIIVAGMIVVVAGITIKKNWSSIKNRFSSSPRAANDRTGVNANGTTPEEVPLQEKSPV